MTPEQKLYIDNKLAEAQTVLSHLSTRLGMGTLERDLVTIITEYIGDTQQYISDEYLLSQSNPPTRIVRVNSPGSVDSLIDAEVKSIYPAPEYGNQAFRVHFENGSSVVVFDATSIVEKPLN